MKKIKKLISVLTALFMALTLATPILAVDNDNGLDNTDLLIIAHNFMGDDEGLWPTELEELEIVPLYDLDNNVVAQYLKFSNAGYAVINNDKNNPTAIEFGYEDNVLIRDILSNNSQPHIIYNSPVSVYELSSNDAKTINEETSGYYENYADLNTRNNDLANILLESKQIIENSIIPYGDGDYGFIKINTLPIGNVTIENLRRADSIDDWAITYDYKEIAKNHCGVIAMLNFSYYSSKIGFPDLYFSNHDDTFHVIYPQYLGNGPSPTMTEALTIYVASVSNNMYRSHKKSISGNASYKSAIKDYGHMLIFLLQDGLLEAHWVLGIGYREYDNGTFYVRIVDEWNRTSSYCYQPNKGSTILKCYEYWLTHA